MIDNRTIRDHIILKKMLPGSGEPTYETRTASGEMASFTTNVDSPVSECILTLTPLQTGTGDPSPTNIRPITGFTGVTVHVADGESPHVVDNTYPISWQTEAGTVYGGELNATTGVLRVTWGALDLGDLTWIIYPSDSRIFYNNAAISDMNKSGSDAVAVNSKCEIYETGLSLTNFIQTKSDSTLAIGGNNQRIYICDYSCEGYTPDQFKNYVTGHNIVYELATPTEVQLTPTEIRTLLGENNIWHDCNGDSTVEYLYQTGTGENNKKTFLPFFYPIRKGNL